METFKGHAGASADLNWKSPDMVAEDTTRLRDDAHAENVVAQHMRITRELWCRAEFAFEICQYESAVQLFASARVSRSDGNPFPGFWIYNHFRKYQKALDLIFQSTSAPPDLISDAMLMHAWMCMHQCK